MCSEVLWNPKDWHRRPEFAKHLASGNGSRTPIRHIIRDKDGQEVDQDGYNLMWNDARASAIELVPDINAPLAANARPSDKIYKQAYQSLYNRKKWMDHVTKLETAWDLLRFCSGNYKAETLLGHALNNVFSKGKKDSEGEGDGEGEGEGKVQVKAKKKAKKGKKAQAQAHGLVAENPGIVDSDSGGHTDGTQAQASGSAANGKWAIPHRNPHLI